jgi:transcriptional regulator with XRE-family HTH domain/anti-sigma regulatory factor (Ser/Thr protein kinase)
MSEAAQANVVPLGQRLRQHRTERGLSQAQAARELDVARTAYRLWELEAAKPAPDRWRLIASWLGVSISTMLLAEDLIDDDDAAAAGRIADRVVAAGEEPWDDIAAATPGDFFEQERDTIAREVRAGRITSAESGRLTHALDKVRAGVQARGEPAAPSVFRKQLAADPSAPELARTALVVTASGLDEEVVDRAEILASELVTNSVERSGGGSLWLAITVHPNLLRVEVTDAPDAVERPRVQGDRQRWSLAITAELASRWGAGRESALNVCWFEIDVPSSGQR